MGTFLMIAWVGLLVVSFVMAVRWLKKMGLY
jgi:hypothetical protein